jgi:hypothetical protein
VFLIVLRTRWVKKEPVEPENDKLAT